MVAVMEEGTTDICGMVAAMAASFACGVPGTEMSALALGSLGEIRAKSAGSRSPGTKLHGPDVPGALNQRPEIST
ncbi:MAG: hypothetical protein B7Z30_18745 [Rhizobiales bacterium 12-68-15]|nr:MAG: hypothetical protein B7Z30_18745 [Rhizobiales bacterium 12-68-15]